MSNLNVTITRNQLIDRLRTIASFATQENNHSDALIIDLAIQVIEDKDDRDVAAIEHVIDAGIRRGRFNIAIQEMLKQNPAFTI